MKTKQIKQIILTTFITLRLLSIIIYAIFTNNTALLSEIIGILEMPFSIIVAYYFSIK